jgi:ABC-type transport system substrate-binding protein
MAFVAALALPALASAGVESHARAQRAVPAVDLATLVAPGWTNLVRTTAGRAATLGDYVCTDAVTIFDNWDLAGGAGDDGTEPSFTTSQPYCLSSVSTYHFFGGGGIHGPVTVGIAQNGGSTFWNGSATGGNPGDGGFRDWTWSAGDILVEPGSYRCTDDNQPSWSQNATSGGKGFCRVLGKVATLSGPDTTPPTVSITSPGGGSDLTGSVTVTAAASDDVAVDRVEFTYYDGVTHVETPIGTDSSAPYAVDFDTAAFVNRPHNASTVYARAYDTAGNFSNQYGIGVGILNGEELDQRNTTKNATVSIGDGFFGQSFTAAYTGYLSRIDVAVSCTIGGSAATLKVYAGKYAAGSILPEPLTTQLVAITGPGCVSPAAYNTFRLAAPVSVTAGLGYTFLITGQGTTYSEFSDVDVYPGGTAFSSPANDLLFATYVSSSFGGDPSPPTVSVTAPRDGAIVSGRAMLEGTLADPDTGPGAWRFEYKLPDAPAWTTLASGTGAGPRTTWDTTAVPDGEYRLRLVGQNAAGTAAATAPQAIVVHNDDPADVLKVDGPAFGSLDPATGMGGPAAAIGYATCLKLVNYDDVDGRDALKTFFPEAAQALPTVSADRRQYAFHIRSGLTFSNGDPVTARSFKDALERDVAPALNDPFGGFGQAMLGGIDAIYVDGDLLLIDLDAPDETLLAKLATSLGCAVPEGTPATPTNDLPAAGPYHVASYVPARGEFQGQLILNENPHYGGDRPHNFEQIVYTLGVAKSLAEEHDAANTADYAATGVRPTEISHLESAYGGDATPTRFFKNPNLTQRSLGFNTSRPVFASAAVRRAVAVALDRAALAAQYPGADVSDQLLPPGLPGYTDYNIYPGTVTDFSAQATVVRNAGFGDATVNVYLSQCGASQGCDFAALSTAISLSLEHVGLHANFTTFPNIADWNSAIRNPTEPWDITTIGWSGDYADPFDFLNLLLDPTVPGNFDFTQFNDSFQLGRLRGVAALPPRTSRYGEYAKQDLEVARDQAPLAGFASGNNYDFFSNRVGCQISNPYFGIDLAALCAAVDVTDVTLTQDRTAAEAGVATVNPADIPADALPLQSLATQAAPLEDVGLTDSPLHEVPLHEVGLASASSVLNNVLLSQIPLLGRSWSQLLAGTPLAVAPPQSVTFGQALAAAPAAVGNVQLGEVDLSASPLHEIGLAALALGATPLHEIPLHEIAGGAVALTAWCDALSGPPINCTIPSQLATATMISIGIQGAPLHEIPLHEIPLHEIDLSASPLHEIPLHEININGSPLHEVPLHEIVLSTPLHEIPLHEIPLHEVPLHEIPLHEIANVGGLVNCALVSCVNGTLGDAFDAGAIANGATLGDIAPELDGYTLGDLGGVFGDTTLGDLIPVLPDDFTLGMLLVALIDPATFAYEKLPYDTMNAQDFGAGGGRVGYSLNFTLAGATGTGSATLNATIPDGARYFAGSSTLENAGGFTPVADPTVVGSTLTWKLKTAPVGPPLHLHFTVLSRLRLGLVEADGSVRASSSTTIDAAPVTSSVTETLETGDTPSSAVAVQPGHVYFGYVSRASDVDYYTIPAPPVGSRVIVRLGHIGSGSTNDNDLVVYSDGSALRATNIEPVPLQSTPVTDDGIAGSNTEDPLQPQAQQDVPITIRNSGISGISANRGAADETVEATSTGTGTYTIQVTGYNGQTSDLPYTIRIQEDPPVPPPACTARVFPHAGEGTARALPASYSPNVNTLFLVDAKRIGDTYGAAAETSVMNGLAALAARTDLGVSGAVVPVEGSTTVASAYGAWDANPCSPELANAVVSGIGTLIDNVRATHPSLKYVVMVGSDDIVPMGRVPDNTRIANERSYSSEFAGGPNNEYYGSLYARNVLSDQPYADVDPIPFLDRQLYVPDLAVGRLVETPTQIVNALTQFQSFGGVLNPTTALTSGYDFLTDGAQAVATALGTRLGTASSRTLINETWTSADLAAQLFPTTGASPGIASLNAHYDHQNLLPAASSAAKSVTDLLNVSTSLPASGLAGRIWFTMGCHAGLNVSDVVVGSSLGPDWADALAARGAVYGANTGYGLGDDTTVAYSERLMAFFAARLGGTLKIGESWKQAVQDYWASLGPVSVYDEKVMAEATFYGLPMYGVGSAPAPVPLAFTAPAVKAARAATSTSATVSPLALDPISGVEAATFSLTPSFTRVNAARGSYYRGDDGVLAVNYRPLIPQTNVDFSVTGKKLHGILVTANGLASSDENDFNPVFERPTVDLGANEPEPVFADTAFPGAIATMRTFGPPSARQQRGIFATGTYFTGATPGRGVMRRFTSIGGRALYSDNNDYGPPTIFTSSAVQVGSTVAFSVTTTDNTSIGDSVKFVYIVFRDGTGTWQGTYLVHGAGDTWSGGAVATGARIEYFVQVGDTHGNVAVASNKSRYFEAVPPPQPPPPPSGDRGRITIGLSGPTGSAGWYTGPVQVTLTSSNHSAMTYSVDHGAATPFGAAFPVTGNGFHTIDADGVDGSHASAVALIDGTDPAIVITSPARNADYLIGASVAADYTCVDAGSGATRCAGTVANGQPIATSTVGPKNFHVDANDAAGHSSAADQPYRVIWPFSGFFQPISNPPYLNVINGGSAVPIKFGLGGNRGLAIFAAGYPKSERVNCDSNAPLDTAVATVTSGNSALSYDSGSQTYQYVWKTDKTWANMCRQLEVQLVDGTTHVATFKVK